VSSNLTEGTPYRHKHQDIDTRSCRNWKTDRLEEPGVEGSNPSERTDNPAGTAGPAEPYPDGREDVCKTFGTRFDFAPGLTLTATTQRAPSPDALTPIKPGAGAQLGRGSPATG
jgi:hypothetical protein